MRLFKRVGWAERREAHHCFNLRRMMGFPLVSPSYDRGSPKPVPGWSASPAQSAG